MSPITPEKIATALIKTRGRISLRIMKLYNPIIFIRPLYLLLALISLILIAKGLLIFSIIALIISILLYAAPSLIKRFTESVREKAEGDISRHKQYLEYIKELEGSLDFKQRREISQKIRALKTSDKDLIIGKIIFWLLTLTVIAICVFLLLFIIGLWYYPQ